MEEEIKMSTKKGRKRNQGDKEKVFDKNEDKRKMGVCEEELKR